MEIFYAHETPDGPRRRSIFLAGPSPRGNNEYNWRPEALDYLEQVGFDGAVFVPLPRDLKFDPDFDLDAQADWELDHLIACTVVAFWVPRDLVHLPGFTTNVEIGGFIAKGVLGYPKGAPKMRYPRHYAKRIGAPICHTLPETLDTAISLVDGWAPKKD